MNKYDLNLELCSDLIAGSGEGWGAVIDTDVVFDDFGLPYIPGRRIRGILRDSMTEVLEMLQESKLASKYGLPDKDMNIDREIRKIFGTYGQKEAASLRISNLYPEDYENIIPHVKYLLSEHKDLFSKESIRQHFTLIRQQTTIDKKTGVAQDYSLRTVRALRKELKFSGTLDIEENNSAYTAILMALAVRNAGHMGTSRTRGFGEVSMSLMESKNGTWKDILSTRENELKWEV